MNITIHPGKLSGSIYAIPSKSQAHRLLICAAFADQPTVLDCPQTNQDIEATVACLNALGAQICRTGCSYHVIPIRDIPKTAELDCNESGSTLRFMLPVVGALGIDALFRLSGRLPCRPLSPLWEEMERMGCCLSRPTDCSVRCSGQLLPGEYRISGSVSSQFITGLLFAGALMNGETKISIIGKLESKPYVDMTRLALSAFGVNTDNCTIHGSFPFRSPAQLYVEGDWSNAAFFLTAKAIGNHVCVHGLNPDSPQGDRIVSDILEQLQEFQTVSATDIPDLVPVLSVAAAANKGCIFTNIQRLRLKESDRVASVINMLHALGIDAEATETTLTVHNGQFTGGTVDSVNDHRIAMAAAIAATVASGPVTVLNAHCVAKSYPTFWEEYRRLGGNYEQYIR